MRHSIPCAFWALALIAASSDADATTYIASRSVGPAGSVNLSITTDDTLGFVTPANILYFNIFVSDGSQTFTLTNLNSIPYSIGLNLTATSTDLLFDFNGPGYFIFRAPLGGGPFFCLQASTPCYDRGAPGEGLEPAIPDNDYQITGYTGTQIIASVSGAVPEPATWAMMLLGFGGLGFQLRRKRKLAALPQAV